MLLPQGCACDGVTRCARLCCWWPAVPAGCHVHMRARGGAAPAADIDASNYSMPQLLWLECTVASQRFGRTMMAPSGHPQCKLLLSSANLVSYAAASVGHVLQHLVQPGDLLVQTHVLQLDNALQRVIFKAGVSESSCWAVLQLLRRSN
jgi:hypothetical protein